MTLLVGQQEGHLACKNSVLVDGVVLVLVHGVVVVVVI